MSRSIPFASSSNIASIVYDDESQTLTVAFRSGGTYAYEDVPGNVADGFSQAPSAGQYLNTYIKNQYEYEKVSG